jgi:predicted nucleic acid-binding protein
LKNIFVDTNIIIDLIADREPFSKYAIALFSEAEKKKIKLYTSSHAIATTHYLLKKYTEEKKLRQILLELSTLLQIIPIDADIIRKGLKSKYKDFEDALQILCAGSIQKMDCIVTRNIKDFKDADIPVISPEKLKL